MQFKSSLAFSAVPFSTNIFFFAVALLALFVGLGDKRRNRWPMEPENYVNHNPTIFCILITAGATQNDRVGDIVEFFD